MRNETDTNAEYTDMELTPEQIDAARRIDAGEDAPEGGPARIEVRKPLRLTRVPRKQPAGS